MCKQPQRRHQRLPKRTRHQRPNACGKLNKRRPQKRADLGGQRLALFDHGLEGVEEAHRADDQIPDHHLSHLHEGLACRVNRQLRSGQLLHHLGRHHAPGSRRRLSVASQRSLARCQDFQHIRTGSAAEQLGRKPGFFRRALDAFERLGRRIECLIGSRDLTAGDLTGQAKLLKCLGSRTAARLHERAQADVQLVHCLGHQTGRSTGRRGGDLKFLECLGGYAQTGSGIAYVVRSLQRIEAQLYESRTGSDGDADARRRYRCPDRLHAVADLLHVPLRCGQARRELSGVKAQADPKRADDSLRHRFILSLPKPRRSLPSRKRSGAWPFA